MAGAVALDCLLDDMFVSCLSSFSLCLFDWLKGEQRKHTVKEPKPIVNRKVCQFVMAALHV